MWVLKRVRDMIRTYNHLSTTAIKNHMDKTETKTSTPRKLHNLKIYRKNSVRNILKYLQQFITYQQLITRFQIHKPRKAS